MKVSEAIGKLKIGDTVWVKLKADGFDDIGAPLKVASPVDYDYMWLHEEDEISLTEPQGEKVEVPEFIAKLIRKYKERNGTLFCSIADLYNDSDEYKWYVNNAEIYERAWVNGYTVKPKRWVVKYKPTHHSSGEWYFIGFVGGDATLKPNCASHVDCKTVIKFTDKSKAEAVAVLVEGSVEEV